MKIYVVTKGEYSDYHIITATTDKELAEKIANKFTGDWDEDEASVEEYEDAEIYLKPIWKVKFDEHGNIKKCEKTDYEPDYKIVNECNYYCYNREFSIVVEADNEEHAIKIASEKRAEYLARKAGIA